MIEKQLFKFQPFSRKQRKVFTWWIDKSPVAGKDGIIADGAIRSGKTVSMSLSYVMWAMENYNMQNFAMCGKTIGSFRRNVLSSLKLMLTSRGYLVEERRTDNLIVVKNAKHVNNFYIFGGKDERSQDLIQGLTLAGCFFDEVVLMPESFVNQATGRCSVEGSKLWFNCNPDGCFHWFKRNWIDEVKNKNLLYLHFTMDDNLSLAESIKQRYRNMYSGVFYDRYIKGMWVAAEGVIYDMFNKEKHIVDNVDDIIPGTYNVSCDYGTQNATVFLLWAKRRNNEWVAVKEYYYSGREESKQKTDREYVEDLKAFLDGTRINFIVVDPSAASFIAELRKSNFTVKKANNNVLDGIRYVSSLLNDNKIKVHKSCEMTIQEFSEYVWDAKASASGTDKPTKDNDHCMDALRYQAMTVINDRNKVKISSKSSLSLR